MKACENCRAMWPDDCGQCAECGRIFSGSVASSASWEAQVRANAMTEMANENAVKRGSSNVSVHPEFMANLKEALSGVKPPSEQA